MSDELSPAIASALSHPEVWDSPPAALEDAIVAAIAAEPVPIESARRRTIRGSLPPWLTAAAVIAVIAVGAAVVARIAEDDTGSAASSEATLTGTDLAPGASAVVRFEPTPAGLKILLDADGLAGAQPDEMYEAWISDGEIRVSAGTFHLRGGDAAIELWTGTDDTRFHIMTVTAEPIDGVADSSGRVVLQGEFQLPDDD